MVKSTTFVYELFTTDESKGKLIQETEGGGIWIFEIFKDRMILW